MRASEPGGGAGLGEWWAVLAIVAPLAIALAGFAGSGRSAAPAVETTPTIDPSESVLAALDPEARRLQAIEAAFASLCSVPLLIALELEPDCETGVITVDEARFGGFGSAVLAPEAKEDLVAAIRSYLGRLRDLPVLWERLEAIEFRGHADPRANRDPYVTNLVGSQQRPLGLLIHLVGPEGLGEEDRQDLERLAVVSGVSFSRPPASCPEATRECYAEWRRVEIRPMLSEALRRDDWSRTLEGVRAGVQRARSTPAAPRP